MLQIRISDSQITDVSVMNFSERKKNALGKARAAARELKTRCPKTRVTLHSTRQADRTGCGFIEEVH